MFSYLPDNLLFPEKSNVEIVIFIIAMAILCFLLFMGIYTTVKGKSRSGQKTRRNGKSGEEGTENDPDAGRGFPLAYPDKKELKQVIAQYGFNSEQADYFTRLCTDNLVGSPVYLVENSETFNAFIGETLHRLQAVYAPTKETEKSKTLLFTIRETVESKRRLSELVTSTRSMEKGQPFTLITKKEEHYPTIVLLNSPEGLLCRVPRDNFGNELRLPVWSTSRIIFYTHSGQTYEFAGRIIRYESGKNETRMLIAHTNSIKSFPNRQHDRKTFRTPCTFAHVTVTNVVTGKNIEHRFTPSSKFFAGMILDISSGGCSIETPASPAEGEYISIKCILEKKIEDTIIGKIIRINRADAHSEAVMHIQFAKMPRASLNRIFSFIYNHGVHAK